MALIDKNEFQVLRGGVPGNYEGCHDSVLEMDTGVVAASGDFVAFNAGTGKHALLTLGTGQRAFYMVIEGNSGNDSYAGDFTDRVAGIKGTYKVQLNLGAYVPTLGDAVTITAGKFADAGTDTAVGEVVAYDAVSKVGIVDMY